MIEYNYWKSLFENNKYPCYIRHIDTEEIIYANDEFYKAFDCSFEIIGKKFCEVVTFDDNSYTHIKEKIKLKENYEFRFYHNRSNKNYKGSATIIKNNINVFCEFEIVVDTDMDKTFEHALAKCAEIYEQPTETILLSFMELLCDSYGACSAYVYRFGIVDGKDTISCHVQHTKDGFVQAIDEVGMVTNVKPIIDYVKEYPSNILVCDTENKHVKINPIMQTIIDIFGFINLTICKIEDSNGYIVGIVGLSNPKSTDYFDHRLISTISRFVAQEVTREFIDATILQLHKKDLLTGLFNREGYSDKIDVIIKNPPKKIGVLSININGLKNINENNGIGAGDKHIKAATKRLQEHFGYEFFRLSGDEFVGIAENVDKDEFETKVLQHHKKMKNEANYNFSLGHIWKDGYFDFNQLIREAEILMYINKQEYYHQSKQHFTTIKNTVLSELLSYLEDKEFMVYLQPQVYLKDGSLYGAEALIRRYDKKNEKMVFPDQFIPLYEQNSVIRHVDLFVVDEVCRLLNEWGKLGKSIPISVNLSRVTLQEHSIVDNIVEICNKYNVPHKLLVIEVTERVGLIENNVASSLITAFKDNGFNISLDDFGCAYSNIVTLAQIEVDEVKIDKSLVDDLTKNNKNLILVKNVLAMCNELENTSTLAEGIEDETQAKLLHKLGCHLGQGYFYSRPIPVDQFFQDYIDIN